MEVCFVDTLFTTYYRSIAAIREELIGIKGRILIMESDLSLYKQLQAFMQSDDVEVCYAKSVEDALDTFGKHSYCLAILDLQHVDEISIKVLHIMQIQKPIPILVISNIVEPEQKVALFQAGVQAHIEKPVDIDVCVAQAKSLIHFSEMRATYDQSEEIVFGTELVVSPRLRQTFVNGQPIELTRKEFDLLYFLVQSPYQVFSYEQLYLHVWKEECTFGGEDTVRVHIGSLRRKLGALRKNYILNIRGIGYKFIPPNRNKNQYGL